MIQMVYEVVLTSKQLNRVVIATDDERIRVHCSQFGAEALMTSKHHNSGTDRCAEIADQLSDFDMVVNVQGDEPTLNGEIIDGLLTSFSNQTTCTIGSLYAELETHLAADKNVVKVVVDRNGKALYFSRSIIPFDREGNGKHLYKKHVGIYVFNRKTLLEISKLSPSLLEESEKLEQLRWMENGYQVHMAKTDYNPIGIDTPEDLDYFLENF